MKLTRLEQEVLNQFVFHLGQVCPKQIRSVILYGSKARGDSTADSDLDILLLVKDRRQIDRDKIYDFILDAELEHSIDISLSIYDAKEFDRMTRWQIPFAANVTRDGEVLWRV